MTKFLFLLFSIIGFFGNVKADTVDYWHIYYNKTKIKEFNLYSKGEITLRSKDIKRTDSLTIIYFRDTPCSDCATEVIIETGSNFVITKGEGIGTFNPIKISVFDLLLKAERELNFAFFQEKQGASKTQRVLLFKIKLE